MLLDRFIPKDPSLKRHALKTITWRIVGTLDTMVLGWLVTGNPVTGAKIGGLEVITKMVLYFFHERAWYRFRPVRKKVALPGINKALHLTPHQFQIGRQERNTANGHPSFVVWFVGLSGSGKSTIANLVARGLHEKGLRTYSLDGDNTRGGINSDLDFSPEGRNENIRRVAEISRLFVDAGQIVLASFISPLEKDRKLAREIIGGDDLVEIFVDCPLEVCEARDVKGLYKMARQGKIRDFTGISAPFEAPAAPDLRVNAAALTAEVCARQVLDYLLKRIS